MKGYDLQVFVLLLPNHIAHVSLALLDADHVNARHRQVFRWLCPLSLLMNATSLNFYYIYIYIYIYMYFSMYLCMHTVLFFDCELCICASCRCLCSWWGCIFVYISHVCVSTKFDKYRRQQVIVGIF